MDLSCIIQSGDLELYVMGMLPPEEEAKVETLAHLFPEVQEELNLIAATFEAGMMQSAVTPSASLKERVMSSLSEKQETSTDHSNAKVIEMKALARKDSGFSKMSIAASWIFLVVLGALSAYLFTNNNSLKKDVTALKQNAAAYETQLADLNKKIGSYQTYRRLKSDAAVASIALASVNPNLQQQAEVLWNKTTGELFIDPSSLPQAPAGKQYQLWFIFDGKPIDAGMISLTDMAAIQKMKECKGAQMFAITLEKEGGNPTPTMEQLVVAGKVS